MTMAFAQESWVQIRDEAIPLLEENWKEIGHFEGIPMDVNFPAVEAMDAADALRLYSARSKDDGSLLGYAGFAVSYSIGAKTFREAEELGVYLAKSCRRGRIAMRLIQYAEEELKKDGVYMINYHAPVNNPGFGSLLVKLGYRKAEEIYTRRV